MRVPAIVLVVVALAGVASGCAARGAAPARVLPPRAPAPWPGDAIAALARGHLGEPYLEGGTSPAGFDCSGFVWFVFGQRGVTLPRDVRGQFATGVRVDAAALRPGDLVFFATSGAGPSHVGIALGGDGFIHAPSSRGVVRVEHLGTAYWSARYLGARRIAVPAPG